MNEKYLGENLIFIISLPRSGSTLLQRILGGHPDVTSTSEPWVMLHPAYGRRTEGIRTDYGADWAVLGVNEFLEHYTDGPEVYDDAIRAFARTIYANAMQRGGGSRFLDKTPRYVMIVDDLIRLFPAARFVFLLRNPLSVLSSLVNTQVNHDLWTLERFSDELLGGPDAILRGIEKLGDSAIVVRYEDFVAEPEKDLERICAALDLEYSPDLLDYDNSNTIQGFMQDRTGIHKHTRPERSRSESWRALLDDAQHIHFAREYLLALGPDTVARFGYSYDELMRAITEARPPRSGKIFPWSVAIKHPEQLNGPDQIAINSYRNHRDHGPVMARIRTAGNFAAAFWNAITFSFRRS